MKPIRVIMVVRLFYPWIGGAERQAARLAKTLSEKGVKVQIVTGWWYRGTKQRDTIDGIPIFRNHTLWHFFDIKGLRKFSGLIYILTLWWYLWRRRTEYDVIHVHSLSYHTFAAVLAGQFVNRKTLTKVANSGMASDIQKMRRNQHMPLTQFMLPAALQSDCLIATNPTIARELEAAGVPPARIVQLPNGIERTSFQPSGDNAIDRSIRLLFVGRLHHQKAVDLLLVAFQQLVQRFPDKDLHLDLVGDGPLRRELEQLADVLQISQRVCFVGQCDDVGPYLKKANIFVLPSRAEGISNALLEAMASGLPVVVSRIPGNVDVVGDQQNGLLFAPDNAESLAEAVAMLLCDIQLRCQLGRNARQTVETRFSLDHVADGYVALYRDLLADAAWNRPRESRRNPVKSAV